MINTGLKPKGYIKASIISYLASRPRRDLIVTSRQAITQY